MRFTHVVAVAGLLAFAGAARANSPIPSNYVDDFGQVAGSGVSTASTAPSTRSSPIVANYIDDFGEVAPAAAVTISGTEIRTAYSSSIPSNYIDNFDEPASPRQQSNDVAICFAQ